MMTFLRHLNLPFRWRNDAVLALLAAIFAILTPQFASAQTAPAPEPYRNADGFGVDQVTGTFNFSVVEGRIGSDSGGIALVRYWGQSGFRDNWSGDLRRTQEGSTQVVTITFGGTSERFTLQGSSWVAAKANGATLTEQAVAGEFTYRAADGTQITYTNPENLATGDVYPLMMPSNYCNASNASFCGVPTRIVAANGHRTTLTWNVPEVCTWPANEPRSPENQSCGLVYRLVDVRDNASHAMVINYRTNSVGNNTGTPSTWFERQSVKFVDLSQVSCAAGPIACTVTTAVPTVTYAYPSAGVIDITNSQSGTWRVTVVAGSRVTAVRRPGATADTTTVSYDSSNRVNSVTSDGATRSYTWSTVGANVSVAASDVGAGGGTTTTVANPAVAQPTTVTSGTNDVAGFIYDANNRLTRATRPEGDYTNYTRDARGNVIETRAVAKAGSGLADIVSTANYDATCVNLWTCNLANYVVDPLGNRTDYTYDPASAQLVRVQLPSPTAGAPRPEVNYSYTLLYAKERNAAGNLVNVGDPMWLPTRIAGCATAATCAGTASETVVTIAYADPNLNVTSVTTAAGDNSISATTNYAYDANDNLISTDGPLPGNGDTTTYIYDATNRRRGVVGPDPDDSGPRARVGERYTFNGASQVSKVERGTVTAATAAALDAMTVLQSVDVAYDANGDRIRTTANAGGSPVSVVQYAYDAQRRATCTALRMNPATWAALPADACVAATAGTDGPDRITRNSYDANDRVVQVEEAIGTTVAATERAITYTANGQVATQTDGVGNRTTYVYDGFDRAVQTRYPVAAVGANASNTADYELLTYDAASRVVQRRLRDGQVIGLTYDNLGRLIARDRPGTDADLAYDYDLSGRITAARFTSNVAAQPSLFTYDALGRQLSSKFANLPVLNFQYDAAGRRTHITWYDGLYTQYDYDSVGNVTTIRENGATTGVGVLATYSYDALGRRSNVAFGNGTSQAFTFDNADRLTNLTANLAGTARDLSVSYSYNPAGQISEQTRSPDAYAWNAHYNIDRLYSVNGLNQILTSGQLALGYDARGNLTTSGSNTYTYSADNQLRTAPGGVTLHYDQFGRLYRIWQPSPSPGTVTMLQWDGNNLVAEFSPALMLRRYVHGPGTDEPIVQYEGAGTTDRRFLMRDERNSIVAVSNSAGGILATNSYDEYGIPAATNQGRFQYTGQLWLPEIGMYYYKARIYSPTLGRFLQTDPIGYADGINWYAYVRGDPVNFRDPTGMCYYTWDSIYKGFSDGHMELVGAENFEAHGSDCYGLSDSFPTRFGIGGGTGGASSSAAQAAAEVYRSLCSSNQFANNALNNSTVNSRIAAMLTVATLFDNEYGFMYDTGSGRVGNLFTSGRENEIFGGDALLPDGGSFANSTSVDLYNMVYIHSHQHLPFGPLSGSDGDVYFAFSNNITVIAVDASLGIYCSVQPSPRN